MMTREEFLKELEYADDILYPGKFSPFACNIADHDQAQRAVIEKLNGIISRWEDTYAEQKGLLEQQAKEIEALRAALQALYDCQNGCPLPKYQQEWGSAMQQAQQVLKEEK